VRVSDPTNLIMLYTRPKMIGVVAVAVPIIWRTSSMDMEVPLEQQTPWGKIVGIRWDGVERFYFILAEDGCVSLMDKFTVHATMGWDNTEAEYGRLER
jgi:hypothetical protein